MGNQLKKQPAKRIQLVDVVLERKGSQIFEGRRAKSPEDVQISSVNSLGTANDLILSPEDIAVT